jgi:hypothetical protein
MSSPCNFTLKSAATVGEINASIRQVFSRSDKLPLYFMTDQDNATWLDDINTEPGSPQAHLKPKNSLLTMAQLKSIFPIDTQIGIASCDMGFSRMSPEDAQLILGVVLAHRPAFKEVTGITDLINLASDDDAERARYESLLILDDYVGAYSDTLPETHPDHLSQWTGGHIGVIAGRNASDTAVLYGNVTRPKFMKTRCHIARDEGRDIRDNAGRAVLLVPLIPLGNTGADTALAAYEHTLKMGVCETLSMFMSIVYPGIHMSDTYVCSTEEAEALFDSAVVAVQHDAARLPQHGLDVRDFVSAAVRKRYKLIGMHDKIEDMLQALSPHIVNRRLYWLAYAIGQMRVAGVRPCDITNRLTLSLLKV